MVGTEPRLDLDGTGDGARYSWWVSRIGMGLLIAPAGAAYGE
jgi:hypothetical protein